jgi:tetratricopeptide (TPR) repeat protein
VWTDVGSAEVLCFETFDGLPTNLAVLLISPYAMRLRWHARIAAEPVSGEAPAEEGPPDEPETRVLYLARREQFREALEVAQGLNSDKPEFWSVLYVASVKVDGPNSERTEAFIKELRRLDSIEALLQEGNRLTRQERHRLAREKYQQAAQAAQEAGRRRELARVRLDLGFVAHDMGDRGLARQMYLSAIALLDDTPVAERNSLWTSALARALRDYAHLLAKSGSTDALPFLRRAAAIHALEGRLTQVAYCYVTRSELMYRVGRYDEADASAQWAAIVFDAAENIDGWVEAVRLVAQAAAAQNRQYQALGVLRHAASRPLRGGLIGKLLLQMAEVSWAAGRIEDAAAHARRAIAVLPAEHHRERADARRIAEVAATLSAWPRRVAALAGRMFDGKPDRVSTLAARLRRSFIEERIEVLVCSAARGTDLLALDAAGGLGIRRIVVLPFSIDEFRESSVAGGDEGWQRLYVRIVDEVQREGDLIIDARRGATYHDVNERILDEARTRGSGGQKPLALVVWEGQSRDAKDVTGGFRDAAASDFDIRDLLV